MTKKIKTKTKTKTKATAKKRQQVKCEVCKMKIAIGENIKQLDDLRVCQGCYDDAIDSDSYGIRADDYDEDSLK